MGMLKNEYKSFLEDIEKNIKNKEDLDYVKGRFVTFLDVVLDQMDYIMDHKQVQIEQVEEAQKELEGRMSKMQQALNNIQRDIYEDEEFDFEIVCPYCNYEFMIDVDENKTEIECPECQNIIELDWTGEIGEDGSCASGCAGCTGCGDESDSEPEENVDVDDDDDM